MYVCTIIQCPFIHSKGSINPEPGLPHLRDGLEQLHQFTLISEQLCAHIIGWAIFHNSPVP